MRELFIEFSNLKTTIFALVFLAAILTGFYLGFAERRATQGCGELAKYHPDEVFRDFVLLLFGAFAIVVFMEITWLNPAARAASLLVNPPYFLYIFYNLTIVKNANFLPCDDTYVIQGLALLAVGAALPILWCGIFLFGSTVIGLKKYFVKK